MSAQVTIVDLFAGAGGTSDGALQAVRAMGRRPVLTAINHWPIAVETHQANHPDHKILCTGVDTVNPRELYKLGELDLLWASPECTHHSIARGGRPINDQSRATAWCVVRWAEAVRPPVILVENVPEFTSWGPCGTNGRPLQRQKGATFKAWIGALESLGYRVEWRVLCAADYGDPTTRRRLFVQAVCGRRRVVWPEPTHADGGSADLFGSRKPWVPARDIIDWSLVGESIFDRARPLSAKTLARIEAGLRRFGLTSIVLSAGGPACPARPVSMPIGTVLTRDHRAVATPFLIPNFGERDGQLHRHQSIDRPLPTVTGHGAGSLVEPFLVQVAHGNGGDLNGDARRVRSLGDPLPTVCGQRGDMALIEPALLGQQSGAAMRPVSEPAPTVATAGAIALVEPFLVKYYGTGGARPVDEPLDTVTTKHRHALVRPTVVVDGQEYRLDIRFRMLQPHELAAAQGFRSDYVFCGTKTDQVKQIGNAVPRRLARALVAATLSQQSDVSWLGNNGRAAA